MSKKRVSGAWVDDTPHIYNTSTDTFSTLPHEVIGDGTAISSYTIKGNMTQSGTPTPSNPVYPTECGDKTANLFNEEYPNISTTIQYLPINVGDGQFTASTTTPISGNSAALWFLAGNVASGASGDNNLYNGQNRTVTAIDGYVTIAYRTTGGINPSDYKTMLNEGSTAQTYEPYGYKIPISLNNVTYPIYISEPLRKSLDGSNLYDTIESNGTLTRRVDANGDALATPTTEQVTVPTLTTTGTAEQFNVLTTLAPSEVSLTYHGWHEHSDTKYTTP